MANIDKHVAAHLRRITEHHQSQFPALHFLPITQVLIRGDY